MKPFNILLTAGLVAMTTMAVAQPQYIEYLGEITVPDPILPIAGDSQGRLVYGTFSGVNSSLYVIQDSESAIGTTVTGDLIATKSTFQAGRGFQSLQITTDDTLFVGGDTGIPAEGNLWKFNSVPGAPPTWAEDEAFNTNVSLVPARRGSITVIDEASTGVLVGGGLTDIDFFDFSGNHIEGPNTVGTNYMREILYNSVDNVLYPLRNGSGSQKMIDYYLTGVTATNTGTKVVDTLIADGAANGAFGSAVQNGFYNATDNQLITVDGAVTIGSTAVPPKVRVWDITDNGTSLTLAYSVTGTTESLFTSVSDITIINNRMYVSSSGQRKIFVFGPAPSAVKTWDRYEAPKPRQPIQ